uniref:DUF11 domain-containing protein n=1 Tax=uncultured marine thaumarchaeote KM3_84_F03 TaxID=1456313 RepID=A0A075HYD0_9ARCH|nr:hypothetical protein [uncultured marine thaumarchaeote KM3_84_F03]
MLLLLTTIVSFPNITASDNYSENLSVTVSGDLTYWSISLSDVNATGVVSPSVSSSGVDSFEVFHYSHQGSFEQSFDIFTTNGYGLIDSTLPRRGALLTIHANSQSSADRFAHALSDELHLGFITYDSISSQNNVYSYYSYAESNMVVDVFWDAFSNNDPGFNQLVDKQFFNSNSDRVIVFSGEKQQNDLVYSIEFAGISSSAVVDKTPGDFSVQGSEIDLNTLFGINSINSSSLSTKSTINIQTFGSMINSVGINSINISDVSLNLNHDIDNIQSELIIDLSRGSSFNSTHHSIPLDYYPPVLSVVRVIDKTSGSDGDTIESRITFSNLSPVLGGHKIDEVTFTDDWWTEDFSLLESGQNNTIINLMPGKSVTLSKLLQVDTSESTTVETSSQDTVFEYRFQLGDDEFSKTTLSNSLYVELNDVKPALIATSHYNNSYVPIHDDFVSQLEIKNLGARSAYDVSVELNGELFESFESIAPNSFEILELNISRHDYFFNENIYEWKITWSDGVDLHTISSNPVSLINDFNLYSHPIFNSPEIVVDKISAIPITGVWGDEIEVILRITNNGAEDLTDLHLIDLIPSSVVYSSGGDNLTKLNDRFETTIPLLQPSNSSTFVYYLKYDSSHNTLLTPASVDVSYHGKDYRILSDSIVLPTAIHIDKNINTNSALVGYNFTISVDFANKGNLELFDVQINGNDPEYVVQEGAQWNERSSLEVDGIMNYEYLIASRDEVNRNLLQAWGEFTLGGQTMRIFTSQIPVNITEAPVVTIKTIPNEILDNQEIELIITIDNPSKTPIKSISVVPGVIENLEILDESIFTEISQLNPEDSIELKTTAKSLTPGKQLIFKPEISHKFMGQLISVDIEQFSTSVSEELINRYLPTLVISLVLLLFTVYAANSLVKRKN